MMLNKSNVIFTVVLVIASSLLLSTISGFTSFKGSIKNADFVAMVKVAWIEDYGAYFCDIINDYSKTKYNNKLIPIVWIENEVDDLEIKNVNIGDTLFVSLDKLQTDIVTDLKYFVIIKKASDRSFLTRYACNSILVVENGFVEDYILCGVDFDDDKITEKDRMKIEEIEHLITEELKHN